LADKNVRAPFQKITVALSVSATLLVLSVSPLHAQSISIHTLAGNTSPGSTNGFGSNARFDHATAVTADPAGNVYVADTENGTLRKISPNGFASTLAGSPGVFGYFDGLGANARFYGPEGIVADSAGQIYVADCANGTIRKVTAAGVVRTFAGTPGSFNSFDGSGTSARFFHPEGLALDNAGSLYVCDSWNHTIRKISVAGDVTTLAGLAGYFGAADGTNSKARFNRPCGIVVDSATNIYVADCFNHTIRKITANGLVSTIAGLAGVWGSADGTNNTARLHLPQGLALSPSGELFFADSGNQTLRKASPSGTNWVVTTVCGLNGLAGSQNGTGSGASFSFPSGLAFDSAGNLYVADMANNMIRTTRVVPPTLQSSKTGNQIVLSWPSSSDGFILEQSASVAPGSSWSTATNGVATLGDNFVKTNTLAGTAFFRLRYP